jgi:DNA-binding XRE family transcriptional regulator
MASLKEVMGRLPPERQEKIHARAKEIINEQMSLRDLRKAQSLTQATLARTLDIKQGSISEIENKSDMLLSTMRSYVEAMGGALDLVVRFPNRQPVTVTTTLFDKSEGKVKAKKRFSTSPVRTKKSERLLAKRGRATTGVKAAARKSP